MIRQNVLSVLTNVSEANVGALFRCEIELYVTENIVYFEIYLFICFVLERVML